LETTTSDVDLSDLAMGRAPASPKCVSHAMLSSVTSPVKRKRMRTKIDPTVEEIDAKAKAAKLGTLQNGAAHEMRNKLEHAATALRPDGFNGKLPCREGEQEDIRSFLHSALELGGSMQVLYISGMPGTGKTACFLEAVQQLRINSAPAFQLVHINAMRLAVPGAVFGEVSSQLPELGYRSSVNNAHGEVSRFFSERSKKDPVVLLLIDEIDQLVTRSQSVIYRIFDWLAIPGSRLVMAAISNTMDLPERLLPRVASRFSICRIDFEPYKKEQILKILKERLTDHEAGDSFKMPVLMLCSARVAAGSGDIRKALQLCRRAIQVRLANPHEHGPVDYCHLEASEKDLLHANPASAVIAGLGIKARRFLAAILLEMRQTRSDSVVLEKACVRYERLTAIVEGANTCLDPVQVKSGVVSRLDDCSFLMQRLEAMSLLTRQTCPSKQIGPFNSHSVLLGAGLDIEDLAGALQNVEEDDRIRKLFESNSR